jgi:hypothetical protein
MVFTVGARIHVSIWAASGCVNEVQDSETNLARIIHEASTVAADPGMSTSLRSFGRLDVLSSTPTRPSVALIINKTSEAYIFITWREAPSTMPVCAASLRAFMNNAG